MTYMEQHIVDHCRTAQDVRLAAIRVQEKRGNVAAPYIQQVKDLRRQLDEAQIQILEISRERDELKIRWNNRKLALNVVRPVPDKIKIVILAVCENFEIHQNKLLSHRRQKDQAMARQVAMYLCTELFPKFSLIQIGKAFDRDHTTVLHACRKIRGVIVDDSELGARIDATIKDIHARLEFMRPELVKAHG